jgi:hypothetical protein
MVFLLDGLARYRFSKNRGRLYNVLDGGADFRFHDKPIDPDKSRRKPADGPNRRCAWCGEDGPLSSMSDSDLAEWSHGQYAFERQ